MSRTSSPPKKNRKTRQPASAKPLPATSLRQDLYRVLDRVLETGEPARITRDGRILVIAPERTGLDLSKLPSIPDLIVGDPESIVHIDWSREWRP